VGDVHQDVLVGRGRLESQGDLYAGFRGRDDTQNVVIRYSFLESGIGRELYLSRLDSY
jgi:hypothetical protein